jgi:hypothetical protein
MKARIARTETFAGEFANVTVDVELDAAPGQHIREVLELASMHVADRLRIERARRKKLGGFWDPADAVRPLEEFGEVASQ